MRRDGPGDAGGEVSRRGYVPTGTALSPGTWWKRFFFNLTQCHAIFGTVRLLIMEYGSAPYVGMAPKNGVSINCVWNEMFRTML